MSDIDKTVRTSFTIDQQKMIVKAANALHLLAKPCILVHTLVCGPAENFYTVRIQEECMTYSNGVTNWTNGFEIYNVMNERIGIVSMARGAEFNTKPIMVRGRSAGFTARQKAMIKLAEKLALRQVDIGQ